MSIRSARVFIRLCLHGYGERTKQTIRRAAGCTRSVNIGVELLLGMGRARGQGPAVTADSRRFAASRQPRGGLILSANFE